MLEMELFLHERGVWTIAILLLSRNICRVARSSDSLSSSGASAATVIHRQQREQKPMKPLEETPASASAKDPQPIGIPVHQVFITKSRFFGKLCRLGRPKAYFKAPNIFFWLVSGQH